MMELLSLPDWDVLGWIVFGFAFLAAGIVKGAIGFAMPIVAVAGLGLVLPHSQALALIPLPVFLTNFMIFVRFSDIRKDIHPHVPVFLGVLAGTAVGGALVGILEANLLSAILGVGIIAAAAIELVGLRMVVSPSRASLFGGMAGLVSGAAGALTTILGPPLVLYLMAINIPKERYLGTVGVLWLFGSCVLLVTFVRVDILTPEFFLPSLLAMLPVQAGLRLGRWMALRLGDAAFRRVIMVSLLLLGLTYVFRAVV